MQTIYMCSDRGGEYIMKKSRSLTLYKRLAVILFIILVIFTAAVIVLLRTPDARYRHNVNLGSRYMHNQEYDEAVRVFTKAIDIDPRRSEAYEKRGEAYMDLGRPEQAYDDYKRVEDLTGEKGLAERKTGISDPSQAGASPTETPKPVPSGADPAGNSGPQGEKPAGESPAGPTPTPSPEVMPTPEPTPETAGPIEADYNSFLSDVRNDPYGYFISGNDGDALSDYTSPQIMYAIGDLDNDEVDEIFLSYTNSGMPYEVINTEVWAWNGSSFSVYSVDGGSYETKDFYSTGYIRTYPKNPKTLYYPFTVRGYDPETQSYDIEILSAYGVSTYTAPPYGQYLPELDADGDGIIYYVNDDTPLTAEEYEAMIEPYVPDRAKVELTWQLLISF